MRTMNKIEDLLPKENELILLDTCVLLLLFYTSGDYRKARVAKCTRLFTDIIKSKARIVIFPELISEFFNRFVKMEYDAYITTHNLDSNTYKYKDFRQTEEFNSAICELKEIYNQQLLPYGKVVASDVNAQFIVSCLDNLSELDINDVINCKVAKTYNAKLVTSDSDYLLSDLVAFDNLYYLHN